MAALFEFPLFRLENGLVLWAASEGACLVGLLFTCGQVWGEFLLLEALHDVVPESGWGWGGSGVSSLQCLLCLAQQHTYDPFDKVVANFPGLDHLLPLAHKGVQ